MVTQRCVYLLLIFLIGFISCYDNALSVVYQYSLPHTEQNPIGLLLINNYGVEGFVAIKAAATIIVVMMLYGLSHTKYAVCIIPVFIIQCVLFWYLSYYDGRTPYKLPDGKSAYSLHGPTISPIEAVINHFIYNQPFPEIP